MEYKLIDSGKTIGDSLVMGCKIYKTKYDDLWLSEIDTYSGKDLRGDNILCLVSKNGRQIGWLSTLLLEDEEEMNTEIDFYYIKDKQL